MVITAIKQQAKRADRFSIYVDGKYSFSVGENELLKLGLYTGQELTEEQLDSFKDESAYGKWFDRALNLLSYRLRSEWEITDYLKRKDCPPYITEKILSKLKEKNYIDDKRFAETWVSNRRLLKATSRRRLAQELRSKRIDGSVIESVLAGDKEATDEREVLRQLVEKKRQRYPDQLKLMQYLARQGYSYDDIKTVLAEQA